MKTNLLKVGKENMNWKGKLTQAIIGDPWFSVRSLIQRYSSYIKGDVIDLGGGGDGKHSKQIKRSSRTYANLDFLSSHLVDIVADLDKPLPIENEKYDTALCLSTLYALKEPKECLKEIYRILKPNGYLLLYTPWCVPPFTESGYNDYYRFSRQGIEWLVECAGFKVAETISVGGKTLVILKFLKNWLRWKHWKPFNLIYLLLGKWLVKEETKKDYSIGYFLIAKK